MLLGTHSASFWGVYRRYCCQHCATQEPGNGTLLELDGVSEILLQCSISTPWQNLPRGRQKGREPWIAHSSHSHLWMPDQT